LIEQLSAKLGQPDFNAVSGAVSYQWPDCGRAIVFPSNAAFRNKEIPVPEQVPKPGQQKLFDELMAVLYQK
jgi:hypothetical protein